MNSQISNVLGTVQEKLKTVYDPEFPMVDIYTLGLIYKIDISEKDKTVDILMTFTTPFCPMADALQEMVKNAVLEVLPDVSVQIAITFDPPRSQEMIKDPDLQRMFQ